MKTPLDEQLWKLWNETGGSLPSAGEVEALNRAIGHGRRRGRWALALTGAAIVAGLFTGAYFLTRKEAAPTETVILASSSSSKAEFTLPDGSRVWLNNDSRLRYAAAAPRSVALEGEAFFDVAKKDGETFEVTSGKTRVKVLGTRFNFRSSPRYDCEEISLVSGKVELSSGGQTLLLSPGERASVGASGITKQHADVTCDEAWTGDELVFQNMPVRDILRTLEHWYHLSFRTTPELNLDRRLSFKIRSESPDETFAILRRLSGLRFKELDDNTMLITK